MTDPDFRRWTPDKYGVIPTRPMPASQPGRASKTTGGTVPRPTRATRPTTGAKATRRGSAKPKVAKTSITGPRDLKPLTDHDLARIGREHALREYVGDARDVEIAPCGVCGGPVSTATMRYSAPFAVHPECWGLSSPASRIYAAAPVILGAAITRDDARVLAAAVEVHAFRNLPTSQPVTESGRLPRPWGHLDKRAIKQAVSALPRLRTEVGIDPAACADGPCAWCGVRKAVGWIRHGHRWFSGQPAPLCGRCSGTFERYGSSPVEPMFVSDYPSQRRVAYFAMLGREPRLGVGAPAGFRVYAEVCGDGHTGHDMPFGYIPAEQRPGTIEHRLAQAQRRLEDDQRRLAEQAERQAAEQAEAQAWGWGTSE